ncbi:MAG: hypothetical protein K2Y22_15110 [Candidatus Obscuribacterales bacterium]|nr:hypothetical protein [Candidatus Obscuribacterales bacterium]
MKILKFLGDFAIRAALFVLDVCDYASIVLHGWLLAARRRMAPAAA